MNVAKLFVYKPRLLLHVQTSQRMKKFREGVTVETAVKNIQDIYQDDAPVLREEEWFAKFGQFPIR